jgi:hypothetical protein
VTPGGSVSKSAEALVGEAVLSVLAERPLPGEARARLAREIASLLKEDQVPSSRLQSLLAVVLGIE